MLDFYRLLHYHTLNCGDWKSQISGFTTALAVCTYHCCSHCDSSDPHLGDGCVHKTLVTILLPQTSSHLVYVHNTSIH